MNYTQEAINKALLDDACSKLKKALTPQGIERREREQKARAEYIRLVWTLD